MLIDFHTHTHNSPDADKKSVADLCRRAIELNLDALAVTDHCEVNRFYSMEYYHAKPHPYNLYDFGISFEKSMEENIQAKEMFKDKLDFICGIELGQATHDFETAEKVVSDKRLDFIIGSMHELPAHDDFAFLDYSKENIPLLLKEYFEELLKLCRWGKFDILGHLTYTLRYIEGEYGYKADMSPYRDIIAECFTQLIDKGKGIEINTSGLRQKYGRTFPEIEYVKLFRDLGGKIISVGSDSHSPDDLAKGIKEGIELAHEAGFEYVCCFKQHQPVFMSI
jgi:histidinol-phosphatase (PHP family)